MCVCVYIIIYIYIYIYICMYVYLEIDRGKTKCSIVLYNYMLQNTETKRYCVTIEQSRIIYCHAYYANL